jgi:chemotaxis protein histidine kinase CheA
MLAEIMTKQDKIIGYFLDEAQEHLRVIEEALITPKLLSQPAQIKEVFRAAHSIKGGAAMLELDTIQKIGHHFEQAFKQIKEKSLSVDEQLQDLMLEGFELLSLAIQLLRQHQAPPEYLAQEGVFEKMQTYISQQAGDTKATADTSDFLPDPTIDEVFGTYVSQKLLQFNAVANKPQTTNNVRQELSDICQKVGSLGDNFDFTAWKKLLVSCQLAINNPQVTIAQICDTIPNAIKQAQVLVIAGRHHAITSTPELEDLITTVATEDSLWLDETNLDIKSALTELPPYVAPLSTATEAVNVYNADEFMQFFDEELPVDGTWVQDEDVLQAEEFLALDNYHLPNQVTNSADADEQQSAALWSEDISARPIPSLTLEESDFNLAYHEINLESALNLPQFSFEEPDDSELIMEKATASALPAPTGQINATNIANLSNKDIDWSGLLAEIPDAATVDYQELAATDSWPSNEELQLENPAVTTKDDWSNDPFALLSNTSSDLSDDDLADFVLEPISTDFATTDFPVSNSLIKQGSSILDTDNFQEFTGENVLTPDDSILEILEFDAHQFSFDSSSQPPDNFEIANVFSINPPPLEDPPDLPTLDELMAQSLKKPAAINKIIYLGIEDWQELSIFDDLLADTKTTDVNIADLNQILINGNVDPELELEDLEDLSDFFASLSQL